MVSQMFSKTMVVKVESIQSCLEKEIRKLQKNNRGGMNKKKISYNIVKKVIDDWHNSIMHNRNLHSCNPHLHWFLITLEREIKPHGMTSSIMSGRFTINTHSKHKRFFRLYKSIYYGVILCKMNQLKNNCPIQCIGFGSSWDICSLSRDYFFFVDCFWFWNF